jgi:hypothetical protein
VIGNLVFNLAASPTAVFVNETTSVRLTATTDKDAEIEIFNIDGSSIATGEGKSLVKDQSVTPSSKGTLTFRSRAKVNGVSKDTTRNISAVYPIYYGSGSTWSSATTKYPTAKTSPAGTYSVTVASNGQHVFFLVPDGMTINKATMSGFDMPFKAPVAVTKGGVAYKSYESQNTYDAGTLSIVLS